MFSTELLVTKFLRGLLNLEFPIRKPFYARMLFYSIQAAEVFLWATFYSQLEFSALEFLFYFMYLFIGACCFNSVNVCIFHFLDFCGSFTPGRMMNNCEMCMISSAYMTVPWLCQKMILLNLIETLTDL